MRITGIWLSVIIRVVVAGFVVFYVFVGIVKLVKYAWYM